MIESQKLLLQALYHFQLAKAVIDRLIKGSTLESVPAHDHQCRTTKSVQNFRKYIRMAPVKKSVKSDECQKSISMNKIKALHDSGRR